MAKNLEKLIQADLKFIAHYVYKCPSCDTVSHTTINNGHVYCKVCRDQENKTIKMNYIKTEFEETKLDTIDKEMLDESKYARIPEITKDENGNKVIGYKFIKILERLDKSE